jgi:hypothetical protein
MSKSTLDVTTLQFDDTGNPILLTTGLNSITLTGTGGTDAVEIINIENLQLTDTGVGTNKTKIQSASGVTPYTITLPPQQGTNGQILYLDASLNLQWSNPSSIYNFTNVTTATYTALDTDHFLGVSRTTAGTCTITLPLIATVGKITYEIIDTGGNAENNNITIVPTGVDTISGEISIIISENSNAVSLTNDGTTSWFIF